MNKTRSLIFIIGIILLVLLGVAVVYIVYNKANDNNVDSSTYTDSSLDFNGCIDSAKSTCIKNLKLDGKNIKLEISVEKTYIGEKVSDAYVDIKSNGKTILEKGYVSYTSDGEYVITFSMDKTDSLLIFDSCASSFCGIKIVDSDLNIKEITQLDNNLPGMWIKRDRDFANIEKLGNNKF
jgi:cbb3-type cytochrome oxidase subunit 3